MLNLGLVKLSRTNGFLGFSEGDGAILSYNGRPLFVLTQKEESVLQHILSVLGFGTVRKIDNNGTIVYRYIVEDFTGIYF